MRRSTNRRSRTSWREVVEWRQPQVVCRWGDISLIVGPPRARGDEPFVPPPPADTVLFPAARHLNQLR